MPCSLAHPTNETGQERVALAFRARRRRSLSLAALTTGSFRSLSCIGTGTRKETGSLAGKLSIKAWSSLSSTLAFNARCLPVMPHSYLEQHVPGEMGCRGNGRHGVVVHDSWQSEPVPGRNGRPGSHARATRSC